MRRRRLLVAVITVGSCLALPAMPLAAAAHASEGAGGGVAAADEEAHHPSRLIVTYRPGTAETERRALRTAVRSQLVHRIGTSDREIVSVAGPLEDAAARLRRDPRIERVSMDGVIHLTDLPAEPRLAEEWGLHNRGQTIAGKPAAPDVDIDWPAAAKITLGDSSLVVGIVDDGIDFGHPDLANRRWVNPGESGVDGQGRDRARNGRDDDHNGFVDDVNGWDFCHDDASIYDAALGDGHGTHVAGTLAASLNGVGTVGVAPRVRLMALKIFCGPVGYESDAIRAFDYAERKGVRIVNNSWSGNTSDVYDVIKASPMLFVFGAGNGGDSGDEPGVYRLPNLISVAAVGPDGTMPRWSAHSGRYVDVAAPGVSILSTVGRTPKRGAITLSRVGTGRAVVAGFGIERVAGYHAAYKLLRRALDAVGWDGEPIVLVADGLDEAHRDDLEQDLRNGTGRAPTVIDVVGNGPRLSQLRGRAVIWLTGYSFFSNGPQHPVLTDADQTTISDYLAGGGRLVLSGLNVFRGIERSAFVTQTLGLSVASDVGRRGGNRVVGISGTPFEGLTAWTARGVPAYSDALTPTASRAHTVAVYPAIERGYEAWDGTSMATPHVTGVAALVASVHPELLGDTRLLRTVILSSVESRPELTGKTVTGGIVDADGAVMAIERDHVAPVAERAGCVDSVVSQSSVRMIPFANDARPGSGISEVALSNDGETWTWLPFDDWAHVANDPITWHLPPGDGAHTVQVRLRDIAGNVSAPVSCTVTVDTVAPTASGPFIGFVAPAALTSRFGTVAPIDVWWTASDSPGSGIDYQQVYVTWYSDGGHVDDAIVYGDVRVARFESRIDLRHVASLSVSDRAGRRATIDGSPMTFYPRAIDDASAAITYTGSWTTTTSGSALGGATHRSSTAGDRAVITFASETVALVMPKGPAAGTVEVAVDSGTPTIVDLGAPGRVDQAIVFAARGLATGVAHAASIIVVSGAPELDAALSVERMP